MFRTIRQAYALLNSRQRRRWLLLALVAVFVSLVEMAGAVVVLALLSLVAGPDESVTLPIIGDIDQVAPAASRSELVVWISAFMGLFFLIRAVLTVAATYAEQRMANNAGASIAAALLRRYLNAPFEVHLRRNSSELIRNTHEATRNLVTQVLLPTIRIFAEITVTVGLLAVLLIVDPITTAFAIVAIGTLAVGLLLYVQPRLRDLGSIAHETSYAALAVLQETFHGIREVKLSGTERHFEQRFLSTRERFARSRYLGATLSNVPSATMELGVLGLVIAAFLIAVASGNDSTDALSTIGLFAYVAFRLKPSIQRTIAGFNSLRFASAPLDDLYRDLYDESSLPRSVHADGNKSGIHGLNSAIVLEDVSFRYAGSQSNAVEHVTFTIRAGEQIGLCGPTGGGKTTLVNLISGLLSPTEGTITVDSVNLSGKERSWQRQIGFVPQDVFLIDASLRENIAFGLKAQDIDEDLIQTAIADAQLGPLIDQLHDGLDTHVGERGLKLSGGQRQRVAIARALYRQPDLLIFDEGTSALDNTTEAELMEAINRLRGGRTIILIAHRLSTVREADRVLFVADGRITGLGTFEQLVAEHEQFRLMAMDRSETIDSD